MIRVQELPRNKTAHRIDFNVDSARIQFADGCSAEVGACLVRYDMPTGQFLFEQSPWHTPAQSTSVPPPPPAPKGWPARLNAGIEEFAERPEWKRFDLWAKDITRTALVVFAVYLVCEVVHAFASGAVDRAIR